MASKKSEAAAKKEPIEGTAAALAAPADVIPEANKEEALKTEIPAAETPKKRGRKPADAKKKPAAKGRRSAAAKKETAAEAKTETPKKETIVKEAVQAIETPKKRGRKPAAAKTEAPAEAEKKPAARGKKPAAAKKTAAAEVKTETPKTEAAKKRGKKPAAAKNTASASGKGGRKKTVTYDSVRKAAKKKIGAADLSKIKYPIAVNIELSGSADGVFYVVISDGKINVEPFKYDDYDVYFRADAEELMKVFGDKKNIYDALADGLVKVDGNTKKAILFIHACL